MSLVGNIRKTIRYAQRNGVQEAVHAAGERTLQKLREHYHYEMPSLRTLEIQWNDWERMAAGEEPQEVLRFPTVKPYPPKISVLVPACNPDPGYFAALVDSVLGQTYGGFELVIADAGEDDRVKQVLSAYEDERIIYKKLDHNGGISANTNAAAQEATGEYVAFLDHDDLLTPDALYEWQWLYANRCRGSVFDEDKCDTGGRGL